MLCNKLRKGVWWTLYSAVFLAVFWLSGIRTYAYNTDDHPKVEFTADGQAFTIVEPTPVNVNRDPRAYEQEFWWDAGTKVETGIVYNPPVVETGQHIYRYDRYGMVPITYWECYWRNARCIHGDITADNFHGIIQDDLEGKCGTPYYSGWFPVCADCGEYIRRTNHYMDISTVGEIQYYNTDMGYYYLCPYAPNLEVAVDAVSHECQKVSYNKYQIMYKALDIGVKGTMYPSYHMYNNATEFEGVPVTPQTTLNKCTYTRTGYTFLYWTTNPDGTGEKYENGAEIYNLTTENYDPEKGTGTIILYAQWEKCTSTLVIDGAGGKYEDGRGVYDASTGETTYANILYGLSITLDSDAYLTPPKGYKVSFDTDTTETIAPMESKKLFSYWKRTLPFCGIFKDNIYRFVGANGIVDRLTAVYGNGSITLPTPENAPDEELSFGGWYEDEELTIPAGGGGEEYTPDEDVTLHAAWVDLKLKAVTDLTVDEGKGGVDLTWTRKDSTGKSFKVFQKLASAGADAWKSLYSVDDLGDEKKQEYTYTGEAKTYTVPYTGFYTMEAFGAKGGDYTNEEGKTYHGGKGGAVSAKVWLVKGDVLTITVGGSDGYNGGGVAADFGSGGGMTKIESEKLGTILVAGGGGGAGISADGGHGGSEESLRTDGLQTGTDGAAGSGGGYIGGTDIEMGEGDNGASVTSKEMEYPYLGSVVEYVAPYKGVYQLDVWGGRGGYGMDRWGNTLTTPGLGGFATGTVELEAGTKLYVCVGGSGRSSHSNIPADTGGYNGGGRAQGFKGAAGGGATHIAVNTNRGVLGNYASYRSEVLIVAGGGGGGGSFEWEGNTSLATGGDGGGTTGGGYSVLVTGRVNGGGNSYGFSGAGQTYGGFGEYYEDTDEWDYDRAGSGFFGQGGYGTGYGSFRGDGAGGGGGWFGGGGTIGDGKGTVFGGGGGSGYIGGVTDGYMESGVNSGEGKAKITLLRAVIFPGGGGSNYVIDSAVTSTSEVGVREGDGFASITATNVGYLLAYALDNVSANDTAAPDAIDLGKVTMEENGSDAILVSWNKPLDNGTAYNHQVISYQLGSGREICRSNITTNYIKTGIKEYNYICSNSNGLTVTADNKQGSTEDARLRVQIQPAETKYLHLAPVDVAGNVGETTTVVIKGADVAWGVITDQIGISPIVGGKNYGSVYPYALADKTYYVRADGKAPFNLRFASALNGTARDNYQVDNQIFDIRLEDGSEQQKFTTVLPHTSITGTEIIQIPASRFDRTVTGDNILQDAMNSSASRKRYSIDVNFTQAFLAQKAYSGLKAVVTPVAGAAYTTAEGTDEIKYSDWAADSANAITLYLDGEAPEVTGLEPLEKLNLVDLRESGVCIYAMAADNLSGVKDFWIKIYNRDNTLEKMYRPESDGSIRIEIDGEQPMFNGDFTVTVYAVDNVGNELVTEYLSTELTLETTIERILTPHEPIFRCGESGILTVTTWGYADRVEVEFPQEMTALSPDLNHTFHYEVYPQYKQQDTLEFLIPLYTPDNRSYTIMVRAYKDDRMVEEVPYLCTIEVKGSILDDIRTRLR